MQVIATKRCTMVYKSPRAIDTVQMDLCNHEEEGTKMMVQQRIYQDHDPYCTVVVVVLAVATCVKLPNVTELWISFGMGTTHRYIAAHQIASSLGPNTSTVLPLFHAFTGCDTVSNLHLVGKKTECMGEV